MTDAVDAFDPAEIILNAEREAALVEQNKAAQAAVDALAAQIDATITKTRATAQDVPDPVAAAAAVAGVKYTAVTDLRYASADKSAINATVTFTDLGVLPFTCHADDIESHGRELFARAVAGDFGAIADYVAAEMTEEIARIWRDEQITQSQWLVERHRDQVDAGTSITLTSAQYSALLAYRQALRDWPSVSGFPAATTQPAAPGWLAAVEAAVPV